MIERTNNRPWTALEPSVAAPLRPRVATLVGEVIDAVQSAVPEYASLDPAVSRGVHVALAGFLDLVEGGDETRLPGRDVYERFGQAEARNGRSLDALLTAYRAGARVAWRGFAEAGHSAGVDPTALYTLAEAIFAYIDEISAASAEGHARQQSQAAREQAELRRRLVETLLRGDPEATRLATAAGWELPERVAALAFDADAPDRVDARLAAFAVVTRIEGAGWALVPDPFAPGRRAELDRALGGAAAAIGPEVPVAEAPRSARRAQLALELVARAGRAGGAGEPSGRLVVADDHLLDLILGRDPELASELAARRLAPLDNLPAAARERLLDTLRAWLDAHGEARPAAAALHVHVQTVRYRLGQLRDLLGDALDDPAARLELALALRVPGSR